MRQTDSMVETYAYSRRDDSGRLRIYQQLLAAVWPNDKGHIDMNELGELQKVGPLLRIISLLMRFALDVRGIVIYLKYLGLLGSLSAAEYDTSYLSRLPIEELNEFMEPGFFLLALGLLRFGARERLALNEIGSQNASEAALTCWISCFFLSWICKTCKQ
jgi:hypothetical protein